MSARILLVEDDPLSQELLKGVLESQGYCVETAADGFAAVAMLRRQRYDLALVDYHLPDLDGYASGRLLRDLATGEDRTKLVAVTADQKGLVARSGVEGVFDAVLPKPIDPLALFNFVQNLLRDGAREQILDSSRLFWRERGLADRPRAAITPEPSREQALALGVAFDFAQTAAADLVLLIDTDGADQLETLRARSDGFLLPVVDVTGRETPAADAAFNAADRASWSIVADVLRRFAERASRLSRTVRQAKDLDTRLLAYLFVADRTLEPIRDPSRRAFVRYPGFFPDDDVVPAAERLANRGLLTRQFIDRFHNCAACGSHRLNVREECLSCRSPHLTETPLIHHFRCSHQAVETQFQAGAHLVCPKCSQHLRHYGSDYDKPGTVFACQSCGAPNAEPAIGFSCLDCDAHTDGDAAPTRDVFTYELTPRAVALLTGPDLMLAAPSGLALPQALTDQVASRLREAAGEIKSFTVAEIAYGGRDRIIAQRGGTAFTLLRRLFLENLRNLLVGVGTVVQDAEADYILVDDAEPGEVADLATALLRRCEEVLAEPIQPVLRIIDRDRLAS